LAQAILAQVPPVGSWPGGHGAARLRWPPPERAGLSASPMLEPSAIRRYEAPVYRNCPPETAESKNVLRLPFSCVVLESVDARGGPSPALLHILRKEGCSLVLASTAEPPTDEPPTAVGESVGDAAGQKDSLHPAWYGAVFDKVIDLKKDDEASGDHGGSVLSRFLADEGLDPSETVCFASTPTGVAAFVEIAAGLIVTSDDKSVKHGADVASHGSLSVRQLAWLHSVVTQNFWVACLWLQPSANELRGLQQAPDMMIGLPSALERAELTRVASSHMTAGGHPPWVRFRSLPDRTGSSACTVRLGDAMVACPDWTPMVPSLGPPVGQKITDLPKPQLYCHSLDVGCAQVNHTLEMEDLNGLRVRVFGKRFVNAERKYMGASLLSVKLSREADDQRVVQPPNLSIRSELGVEEVPEGFTLGEVRVTPEHAQIWASYVEGETGRVIKVRVWHRFLKDDGKGDEMLEFIDEPDDCNTMAGRSKRRELSVRVSKQGNHTLNITFSGIRLNTYYSVEKLVVVCEQLQGAPLTRSAHSLGSVLSDALSRRTNSYASDETISGFSRLDSPGDVLRDAAGSLTALDEYVGHPATLAEMQEEHYAKWRMKWDEADIEIAGGRQAKKCQRAVRLFRFHELSRGEDMFYCQADTEALVPPLVRRSFNIAFVNLGDICDEPARMQHRRSSVGKVGRAPAEERPSSLIKDRLRLMEADTHEGGPADMYLVRRNSVDDIGGEFAGVPSFDSDPGHHLRPAPVVSIHPQMPPTCSLLRFNVPLGGRWYRFTLTPGMVKVLMQGPTLYSKQSLLPGDSPPCFHIPSAAAGDGVFVKVSAWHEVQVQHALTELGRPDGSTGGFYVLMRRTRFVRAEALWRHLVGQESKTLVRVLETALGQLRSIPRPPGWRTGMDADEHILVADAATRPRVNLKYEKSELDRDIKFLRSGEKALLEQVKSDYEKSFKAWLQDEKVDETSSASPHPPWVETPMPTWDEKVKEAVDALHRAAAAGYASTAADGGGAAAEEMAGGGGLGFFNMSEGSCRANPPFRNFVTDRDGTINNYCDRYASSVQSAYNAVWVMRFARYCVENAVIITAAPLGGRPSAEGLMDLSVMQPHGVVTYTGSKGREYFDHATQRVVEVEPLGIHEHELVEELHRRLLALCSQDQRNTKFLGIGSGLQRKFGEVTMARNDPAGTVGDAESRRFMAEVRRVKDELDPDGTQLDLHDTGTDMELYPRVGGGRPSFDKGNGIEGLDRSLRLDIARGPNLICGDTGSDVAMIKAAVKLMRGGLDGDRVADVGEEGPNPSGAATPAGGRSPSTPMRSASHNLTPHLAVLFVVSPAEHRMHPELAKKVQDFCSMWSAECVILPSPDVLVASLAHYAQEAMVKIYEERQDDPEQVGADGKPIVDLDGVAAACRGCSAAKLKGSPPVSAADFSERILAGEFAPD